MGEFGGEGAKQSTGANSKLEFTNSRAQTLADNAEKLRPGIIRDGLEEAAKTVEASQERVTTKWPQTDTPPAEETPPATVPGSGNRR
jgi:hypothetical protein